MFFHSLYDIYQLLFSSSFKELLRIKTNQTKGAVKCDFRAISFRSFVLLACEYVSKTNTLCFSNCHATPNNACYYYLRISHVKITPHLSLFDQAYKTTCPYNNNLADTIEISRTSRCVGTIFDEFIFLNRKS